jgi:hypothetical protein
MVCDSVLGASSVGILCDRAHPLFGTPPHHRFLLCHTAWHSPHLIVYILCTYFVAPIGYHQSGLTPIVPAVTRKNFSKQMPGYKTVEVRLGVPVLLPFNPHLSHKQHR